MKNYSSEARQKFVERKEARKAEGTERQFSYERSGVREVVLDDVPKYTYQDSPSDTPEEKREARYLKKFGIEKNARKKTFTGYINSASDKPLKNISRKAPYWLAKVALSLVKRKGIENDKGLELIVRAEDNAKSPADFWTKLERYATKKRKLQPDGRSTIHIRARDIIGTQPMKKPKKGE